MDVYIERRAATEAVRDDRGGFRGTSQSIYADVALTRDRSILDTGKSLVRHDLQILAHPTRFERVAFAFGGQLLAQSGRSL
jgi:hypothetical protein